MSATFDGYRRRSTALVILHAIALQSIYINQTEQNLANKCGKQDIETQNSSKDIDKPVLDLSGYNPLSYLYFRLTCGPSTVAICIYEVMMKSG
jgi:hypothetical protein